MKRNPATQPENQADKEPENELVRQPHGGAIYSRGNPDFLSIRQPGPGRRPSQFKQLARDLIHDRKLLERLADIADARIGEIVETDEGRIYCETPLREQRGAIESLLKIGVGETKELSAEKIRERLAATVDLINEIVPDELAVPLLARMRQIWT
jgi:hypothetical protein